MLQPFTPYPFSPVPQHGDSQSMSQKTMTLKSEHKDSSDEQPLFFNLGSSRNGDNAVQVFTLPQVHEPKAGIHNKLRPGKKEREREKGNSTAQSLPINFRLVRQAVIDTLGRLQVKNCVFMVRCELSPLLLCLAVRTLEVKLHISHTKKKKLI